LAPILGGIAEAGYCIVSSVWNLAKFIIIIIIIIFVESKVIYNR